MKVSKQWLEDFNTVMNHHKQSTPASFRDDEILECKEEARAHEAWALEFYPKAAAIIRSGNAN